MFVEIHLSFSRSARFRSQLDALNIPVFLRVILDRTVRAKFAHLVVKLFDQWPEQEAIRDVHNRERTLAVVRMLFLIHSVRSAYASSTISSARISTNHSQMLLPLVYTSVAIERTHRSRNHPSKCKNHPGEWY